MIGVCFVRHGPTVWNQERRLQGRADIPLSDAGIGIVRGWRLPDMVEGWQGRSSPLLRARQTAEQLGLRGVEIDEDLVEMDWGEFEGRTIDELRSTLGRDFAELERRGLDLGPPGGESPRQVMTRLRRLLASLGNSSRGSVLVTHKGVMRAAIAIATGWDMVDDPPLKLRAGEALLAEADDFGQLHRIRATALDRIA